MSRPTGASIAGRVYLDLQRVARQSGRTTQDVLTMYVVERWLARLSRSEHSRGFVLKGGMLLAAFGQRRTTVDADTWAQNLSRDADAVGRRVAEIAALPDPDDGVQFLTGTVATQVIREEADYPGVRVSMTALVATANVKFKVDVSFGDPITPAPAVVEVPALRAGVEPVRLLGYPIPTVIAEKLTTAISLGEANTRVRDYADVYTLVTTLALVGEEVRTALAATAAYRRVELRPLSEVVGDLARLRSAAYTAYRTRLGPASGLPDAFADVVAFVVDYADSLLAGMPPA